MILILLTVDLKDNGVTVLASKNWGN